MKISKIFLFLFIGLVTGMVAQTSVFSNSTIPKTPDILTDASPVTLGLQFYSDAPGSITGIRFFKGAFNTGQHIGTLWSGSGTKLAEVTFSGETASGWQQANFVSPVSIVANTPYVISYFAPNGNYAEDDFYPWSSVNASPLHLSGSSPGVYVYNGGASFPSGTYNASNYWVDAVFVPGNTPPAGSTNFTSFWTTSTVPAIQDFMSDGTSVTLGLQFYSEVPGSVSGLRFFKGSNNIGPHVGTLWSSAGGKLAEVAFSSETSVGWQQASFSSPVSIVANAKYVISYFAPQGNYAVDEFYSWPTLSGGPLHVASSSPGAFAYASGTSFPQGSFNGSNYWIDPVFVPAISSSVYSISGKVTGSAATVTISGNSSQSTVTDGGGSYVFSGLANGSYVVAPSQAGSAFQPLTALVVLNGASVSGLNFNATPAPHSVTISWIPSTSAGVIGYNVYRSASLAGPYTKLTSAPVASSVYVDNQVSAGVTYRYVATAVGTSNGESDYSNVATATIPVL